MSRSMANKACLLASMMVFAGTPAAALAAQPWGNGELTPGERASMVVKRMTQAEKLSLVRGWLGVPYRPNVPTRFAAPKWAHNVIGSSGYVPGIPQLGIPALQETDASLGIVNLGGMLRPGDVATALPSSLTLGASFDPRVAYAAGAMVAREAWHKGLNVLLGPGMDLVRDPRGGRNFEYLSEDPLLTGTLAAQYVRGVQDQHVVAVVKHFAMNDQETGRGWANAVISDSAMRESDLLAFELAVEKGDPGAVMCAYNLVNGTYSCGNRYLLTEVLKRDWHFKGWVMSDWGAVHSVDSANAGLDQESAAVLDRRAYFGKPLRRALRDGTVSEARLTDMAHRIVRSMFAVGLIDHPATKSAIDYEADAEVALHEAEDGIVLLKNDAQLLPLSHTVARIAVIGGHADVGVLSGGGSSQVYPIAPGAIVPIVGGDGPYEGLRMIFDPSAPLAALRAAAPDAQIRFDPGIYPSAAAKLAKWADVTIVFATQWSAEGRDLPDLSLPSGQGELIRAVGAANPKTIVVLETGSAVTMPWLDKVDAVVEAWYPGQRGGEAIADVLYGKVDPSGHLPITFPKDSGQYPRPVIPRSNVEEPKGLGPAKSAGTVFDVDYSEGAAVGYRWFFNENLKPLFPFGFGLSYTSFRYSHLRIAGGRRLTVGFDVTNTGKVAGKAVPQVYLMSRTGRKLQRLLGFSKVPLSPGQTRHVSVAVDPRFLADFDTTDDDWRVPAGAYAVMVGRSATDAVLTGSVRLKGELLPP